MNTTPATRAVTAANQNPGGAARAELAITGLVGLFARAEARREAAKQPANNNPAKKECQA